jgi:hypothetical protein
MYIKPWALTTNVGPYGMSTHLWAGARPQPFPPSTTLLKKLKYIVCCIAIKHHQWSRRLARFFQSVARRRFGVRLRTRPHNFTQPESQPQGAMWQPMTGPHGTSPTNKTLPLVEHRMVHVSATYPATCHRTCLVNLLTSSMPRVTLTVVTRLTL